MNEPIGDLKGGIDLWEVVKVEQKKSQKGDAMLTLDFARSRKQDDRARDNIMLAGDGKALGRQKLAAFLGENFKGEFDPLDLMGKRVWLSTGVEVYKGRDQLKVLIADLKHAGMQPEKDVPPGCTLPEKGDIPF